MRLAVYGTMLLSAACATSQSATVTPAERVVATDDRVGATVRTHTDPGNTRITVSAPTDRVFDAVTSSYVMLKIPVTYSDKSLGEQGNRQFRMFRTFDRRPVSIYVNCGDDPMSGPNADSHPVTVSVVTRVRAEGGTSSVVETNITGTTHKTTGNTGPIHCASTGYLEEHLAEMIASRVTGADTPKE